MKLKDFYLLVAAACVANSSAAPLFDVMPAAKRASSVETAISLIQILETPQLPAEEAINNPFSPKDFDAPEPVAEKSIQPAAQASTSSRELLASLAPLVQPGGTVMMGGRQILIFGQKKLKVGDKLPIVFADKTYEVVIAAIERTSFTLRLNGEEITRPIKSVNTP